MRVPGCWLAREEVALPCFTLATTPSQLVQSLVVRTLIRRATPRWQPSQAVRHRQVTITTATIMHTIMALTRLTHLTLNNSSQQWPKSRFSVSTTAPVSLTRQEVEVRYAWDSSNERMKVKKEREDKRPKIWINTDMLQHYSSNINRLI